MTVIKNSLDFIEREQKKTATLSSFKKKKNQDKVIKDLDNITKKALNIKNQIKEQNNVPEIKIKENINSTLIQKKRKPVMWL